MKKKHTKGEQIWCAMVQISPDVEPLYYGRGVKSGECYCGLAADNSGFYEIACEEGETIVWHPSGVPMLRIDYLIQTASDPGCPRIPGIDAAGVFKAIKEFIQQNPPQPTGGN